MTVISGQKKPRTTRVSYDTGRMLGPEQSEQKETEMEGRKLVFNGPSTMTIIYPGKRNREKFTDLVILVYICRQNYSELFSFFFFFLYSCLSFAERLIIIKNY